MDKKQLSNFSKRVFNLLLDHKFFIIRYYQKDLGRYLLLLKIMESYFSDFSMSQERILETIPSAVASRSSLLSTINQSLMKNYLKKIIDPNNKRARHIVPTEQLVDEFKQWMKLIHNE